LMASEKVLEQWVWSCTNNKNDVMIGDVYVSSKVRGI
jgi:hypothetical protein